MTTPSDASVSGIHLMEIVVFVEGVECGLQFYGFISNPGGADASSRYERWSSSWKGCVRFMTHQARLIYVRTNGHKSQDL